MYYSSGNHEASARPRKPKRAENRTAWFFSSCLAALAGTTGSLRDGKEIDFQGPAFKHNLLINKLYKTQIGALPRESRLVAGD